MRRGPRRAAGVLAAALVVAGCGSGSTTRVVDEAGLERAIAADLQQQTAERPRVVECPAGREVVAGSRFRCRLRLQDGSASAVRVTLLDADGAFRFELLGGR